MTRAHTSIVKSLRSALFLAVAVAGFAIPASADFVKVKNLVTDDQSANPAVLTDPSLVNAWGISYSPTSPFWVSDNGTGVSTLYRVNPATNAPTKIGLTVSIPGDGSVTGQAFNSGAGSGAFHGDAFLFVSEDGTVSGWRGSLGSTAETLMLGSSSNAYKGTTLVSMGGHSYLYSANFATGGIDVMKGDAGAPNLTGTFSDPTIPAGYHPFNVQALNGHIFVTYALNTGGKDEAHGAGLGFVNEFDTNGNLIGRVGSHGKLDAPWALAIAPTGFGAFGGDLLVGNFGDGTISVFDPTTDMFLGQLMGQNGTPLTIDGLWGLTPGNGAGAGSLADLYFTAGPGDEGHGLFGALSFVPEPISILLFGSGLLGLGLRRRWATAT
jgi:uncharacterized protein (TIGR03118 family)